MQEDSEAVIAASFLVAIDSSKLESESALGDALYALDVNVYEKPVCWSYHSGLAVCRVDTLDSSEVSLDLVANMEGVAAVMPRASPVQAFHVGLSARHSVSTRAAMLARLNVMTRTDLECRHGLCEYLVERSEVLQPVPVMRAHPRSRVTLSVKTWKDDEDVEADLLELGLMPLDCVPVAGPTGRVVADFAGHLNAEALSVVSEKGMSVVGDVTLYFRQQFNVTLVANETSPGVALLAAHAAGVGGVTVDAVTGEATKGLVVTLSTFGLVHAANLEAMRGQAGVAGVSTLMVAKTESLLESDRPFTYQFVLDLSLLDPTTTTAAPTTTTTTTTAPTTLPGTSLEPSTDAASTDAASTGTTEGDVSTATNTNVLQRRDAST